ncbi:MAG: hypothetical protein D6824_06005 [Planctomycetota bacterium]|nr:MAG: hypothetical protein D6824_06005 [Planctomycetota bacterium]
MSDEGYELAPPSTLPAASAPGAAIVHSTFDEAVDALAAEMLVHALNCVRTFGDFHVALCGGRTLAPLYMRLLYDPPLRVFPWARTHVWLASDWRREGERRGRVFTELEETIVAHSGMPPEQAHEGDLESDEPAARYEQTLKEALAWREKGHDRLDMVLLSVGAQGRVAGLRSPTSGDDAALPLVRRSDPAEGQGAVQGFTLTERAINGARLVCGLVASPGKVEALRRASASQRDTPLARLQLRGGELRWRVALTGIEPR